MPLYLVKRTIVEYYHVRESNEYLARHNTDRPFKHEVTNKTVTKLT